MTTFTDQKTTTFANLGLIPVLVKALESLLITTPTPVQAATIPLALQQQDILASAQTGSGKTLAYCLPLLMNFLTATNQKNAIQKTSALILTPTRELATQVQSMLHKLISKELFFRTALLIGGAPIFKQIKDLKKNPEVVIGTPGRINDHLEQRTLSLETTQFLVIDEADRMLDMGFGIQLDRIAEFLPKKRQTLMFSATLPPNINKLSQKYLQNPQCIVIDPSAQEAPKINQEIIRTKGSEKTNHLLKELEKRNGSIIVFVRTRMGADKLSHNLNLQGHKSDAIHGDLPQRKRDRVLDNFRRERTRILVATDVAARGLDITHVMHVINFDLPECPEDYIHRIGRTARAGAEGNALCFITPEDTIKWNIISKIMDPKQENPTFGRIKPNKPSRFKNKRHPFKSPTSPHKFSSKNKTYKKF
jgi:ATP-dependent RNA helicase DeaD